tara:strand:+ start:1256 stop:1375 length:120 start_codon:yes stop_codon:yes gene_type:complete
MNIILATLFISAGIMTVMAIVIESIETYYKAKQWYKNED